MFQNMLYVMQAIMVFVTELYAGLVWAIIVQIALAIMILSIETV